MGGGNPWILSGHVTLSYKRIKDNPWIMLIAFDIIVLNIMSGITWGYLQKKNPTFSEILFCCWFCVIWPKFWYFPIYPLLKLKDKQQECN